MVSPADPAAERGADRHPHERRGAGRGHQHGEQAGEEAAGVAAAPRQRLPRAGAAQPHLVNAGQVQPDGEQHPGHAGDEGRRLELKPPASRVARRRAGPSSAAPTSRKVATTPAV